MFDSLVEILAMSGSAVVIGSSVIFSTRMYVQAKLAEMREIKTPTISAGSQSYAQDFTRSVDNMRKIIKIHDESNLKKTSSKMKSILVSVDDLFGRLKIKGTPDQVNMTSIRYAYLFDKVVYAMDEEHYLDIAKNPHLWEDPNERMRNAENALDSVHNQIVDNIKQVNASKDLDFNTALDALTSVDDKKESAVEVIFADKQQEKDVVR